MNMYTEARRQEEQASNKFRNDGNGYAAKQRTTETVIQKKRENPTFGKRAKTRMNGKRQQGGSLTESNLPNIKSFKLETWNVYSRWKKIE